MSMTASRASSVFRESLSMASRLRGDAGRAETALTALARRQFFGLDEFGARMLCDDELCDLHAARDAKARVAQIDQDHLDLASVIAVDRTWRVEHGNAVIEREARSRAHLRFHAFGQRDRDAARDRDAHHRCKFDIRV